MTTTESTEAGLLRAAAAYINSVPVAGELAETARQWLADYESWDTSAAETDPEPAPLPGGFYGRTELPGYRSNTGWITEETRFGVPIAVVRNWDGRIIAEMVPGPACRIVHLATPPRPLEPESPRAITAGPSSDGDPWKAVDQDDDSDGYDPGPEVDDEGGASEYRHEGEPPF
jgi:hypothetical protein